MEIALKRAGYQVHNLDYPSTEHDIETLALNYVWPQLVEKELTEIPLNFVTHSMGGIILRYLVEKKPVMLARSIMLSPPNHGSELVDKFGEWWLFEQVNGPAGKQLGTIEQSVPNKLGQVDFELGVLTGNRNYNLLSNLFFKGKHDGKVSVESAKLDGMKDFMVVNASHTFIMMNLTAVAQTISFLEAGHFSHQ